MSKIKNEQVTVPTGMEINDKDIVNSLLSTLKMLSKNYVTAATEASNENLFKEYKKRYDSISKLQRETFELLFRKGWYVLEEADGSKVGEKYNTLSKYFDDLNVEA